MLKAMFAIALLLAPAAAKAGCSEAPKLEQIESLVPTLTFTGVELERVREYYSKLPPAGPLPEGDLLKVYALPDGSIIAAIWKGNLVCAAVSADPGKQAQMLANLILGPQV